MAERGFSHNALGHNASRNGDFFVFQCVKIVFNILGGVGSVVLGYLKGILSCRLQFGKLLTAYAKYIGESLFLGGIYCFRIVIAHIVTTGLPVPFCFVFFCFSVCLLLSQARFTDSTLRVTSPQGAV